MLHSAARSAFVLLFLLGAAFADESESTHDPQHTTDTPSSTADGAPHNLLAVGEHQLAIHPLLAPDGTLKLGFDTGSTEHNDGPSDLQVSVTPPSETREELDPLPIDGGVVLRLPAPQTGTWHLEGSLGDTPFATSFLVLQEELEDGTDVTLFLTPTPSVSEGGEAEAFVYAYRDGEALHGSLTIQYAMPGMQHSTDDDTINLTHEHFQDRYNTDTFAPMANRASLFFPMAGTWDTTITLGADPTREVSLDIPVLGD